MAITAGIKLETINSMGLYKLDAIWLVARTLFKKTCHDLMSLAHEFIAPPPNRRDNNNLKQIKFQATNTFLPASNTPGLEIGSNGRHSHT